MKIGQSLADIMASAESKRVAANLNEDQDEDLALSLLSKTVYDDLTFTMFMSHYWSSRRAEDYEVMIVKNPLRAVGRGKVGETKSGKKITQNQELFCQYYTAYGTQTFGNTTASYLATKRAQGLPCTGRKAEANGSKLKVKAVVKERIAELMEVNGWNDTDVDMEHMKVLKQDKDMSNKMRAISEYNKLKQRGGNDEKQVLVNIVQYHNDGDLNNNLTSNGGNNKEQGSNNDTVSVRSQGEVISVTDTGELSEE